MLRMDVSHRTGRPELSRAILRLDAIDGGGTRIRMHLAFTGPEASEHARSARLTYPRGGGRHPDAHSP